MNLDEIPPSTRTRLVVKIRPLWWAFLCGAVLPAIYLGFRVLLPEGHDALLATLGVGAVYVALARGVTIARGERRGDSYPTFYRMDTLIGLVVVASAAFYLSIYYTVTIPQWTVLLTVIPPSAFLTMYYRDRSVLRAGLRLVPFAFALATGALCEVLHPLLAIPLGTTAMLLATGVSRHLLKTRLPEEET